MNKAEVKPIVIYHYTRGKETLTTPNAEIAINRRKNDSEIRVETITNGESVFSVLSIQ